MRNAQAAKNARTRAARSAASNGSVTVPLAEREALQSFLQRVGMNAGVEILGASRTTVLAAAAGCGIRRASAEMISRRLRELADGATDRLGARR